MDIRNVGNQSNVDRTTDRGKRPAVRREESTQAVPRDDAQISASGRETAAAVEGLAERARSDDGSRDDKIESAIRRLRSGELDDPSVIAATAQQIARSAFLSV
ncbi:MAG: hypothetical protein R3F29_11260 [Planctomycetota bacterium]